MKNCKYCEKIKAEIAKLPSYFGKPNIVDSENVPAKELDKLDISIFPTIVWFTDDKRMLKKLVGFHAVNDIIQLYNEALVLEVIQKNKRSQQ